MNTTTTEFTRLALSSGLVSQVISICEDVPCRTLYGLKDMSDFLEMLGDLEFSEKGDSKEIRIPNWIGKEINRIFYTILDNPKTSIRGKVATLANKFLCTTEFQLCEDV